MDANPDPRPQGTPNYPEMIRSAQDELKILLEDCGKTLVDFTSASPADRLASITLCIELLQENRMRASTAARAPVRDNVIETRLRTDLKNAERQNAQMRRELDKRRARDKAEESRLNKALHRTREENSRHRDTVAQQKKEIAHMQQKISALQHRSRERENATERLQNQLRKLLKSNERNSEDARSDTKKTERIIASLRSQLATARKEQAALQAALAAAEEEQRAHLGMHLKATPKVGLRAPRVRAAATPAPPAGTVAGMTLEAAVNYVNELLPLNDFSGERAELEVARERLDDERRQFRARLVEFERHHQELQKREEQLRAAVERADRRGISVPFKGSS
eukprot:gnl/Chilomastix_cuspidata/2701.p1 GENE.gnl/Chilomastix_cuspidata/2701~~gnl/Chilomastix_cuspidata/2701.p1  ORF type:complete len:377 (+),score=138.41 gnl/Chilomastix_cuspidata/2701:117-1133(+)